MKYIKKIISALKPRFTASLLISLLSAVVITVIYISGCKNLIPAIIILVSDIVLMMFVFGYFKGRSGPKARKRSVHRMRRRVFSAVGLLIITIKQNELENMLRFRGNMMSMFGMLTTIILKQLYLQKRFLIRIVSNYHSVMVK